MSGKDKPTGLVCGLGDAIAQVFIEKKEFVQYDLHRTARMTAIGLVFTVRECDVLGNESHTVLVPLANTSILCVMSLQQYLCTHNRVQFSGVGFCIWTKALGHQGMSKMH